MRRQFWQGSQACLALVCLAFLLAIAGQRLLDGRSYWQPGVGLYGLALLLFLLGTGGEQPRPERVESPAPPVIAEGRMRWLLACLPLLLGTAGYLNYQSYFVEYAIQFNTHAWNASELAQVISGFAAACGSLDQAYIAPWPYFVDGRAVAFELGD